MIHQTTLVRDRAEAESMLRRREAAREALLAEFAGDGHVLTEEEVLRIISSVADSNNYQAAASAPVIRMLQFLDDTFSSSAKNNALGDLSISCVSSSSGQSSPVSPFPFHGRPNMSSVATAKAGAS
jgi:hypothetical protein